MFPSVPRQVTLPPDNRSCYSYFFAYFFEFFLGFCGPCRERQFSMRLTQALTLAMWQEMVPSKVGRLWGAPLTLPQANSKSSYISFKRVALSVYFYLWL